MKMQITKNINNKISTLSIATATATASSPTSLQNLCHHNKNSKSNNNNNNIAGKQKSNMLLIRESNKNKGNNYNVTSLMCSCGCLPCCCHSKTKSAMTTTTPATNTIISSLSTKTKTAITITASQTVLSSTSSSVLASPTSSSSTKDNSNYMHFKNTLYMNTCPKRSSSISNSSCFNATTSVKSNNTFENCISNINNNLNSLIKFVIVLIFFTCCDLSQAAIHNVNLYIEPPAVRRSQSVTLRCDYTIEGAPLYSVKFYRGQLEFFRYTPGEFPNTKVFHYPGIKVDESVSNATQVVIRNVNFGLSGNFSCEVTADAPLFSTSTAYAQMQVVEFPDKRPQLFTELTRYEPGDVLRANCSTPPSRPRAELRFTINNIPVSSEEPQYFRTVDNLITSRLSLKVQLQAVHFAVAGGVNSNSHMINALSGGSGGSGVTSYGSTYSVGGGGGGGGASAGGGGSASGGALLLRCIAQIGDLYQEYKEIELGTPQRDPVPARVTSSGGGFRGFLESYFGPSSAATKSYNNNIQTTLITSSLTMIFITFYLR